MNSRAIKTFCLDVIKSTYGYEYDPVWHADLDDLSIYKPQKRGSFVVRHHNGKIVAVGGLRAFTSHAMSVRFMKRYQEKAVGALWRVYVTPTSQRQGYGRGIVDELEAHARRLDYDTLYLHTSENNPTAVQFWIQCGYEIFETDDNDDRTVHMEKHLTK